MAEVEKPSAMPSERRYSRRPAHRHHRHPVVRRQDKAGEGLPGPVLPSLSSSWSTSPIRCVPDTGTHTEDLVKEVVVLLHPQWRPAATQESEYWWLQGWSGLVRRCDSHYHFLNVPNNNVLKPSRKAQGKVLSSRQVRKMQTGVNKLSADHRAGSRHSDKIHCRGTEGEE